MGALFTMSCDGWKIEVLNWVQYNPRTETKRPSWFRFENDLATGPGFHGLNCEIKWVWVLILSLVSQKNGQAITWNSTYIESISGVAEPAQRKAIEIFEQFVRLRVTRTEACETRALRDERTNETDERTDTPSDSRPTLPRLAQIWNEHADPRLPKVQRCSSTRTKASQVRWKECPQEEFWIAVVKKINENPFLLGEQPTKDHPNWKADFDWLMKPDSANKVFEGKYDHHVKGQKSKKKFFTDAASASANLGGVSATP